MDLGIRGRTALVTGASRGIGRACAAGLAAEGCDLHLAARTAADLEAVRKQIESRHAVQVTTHVVDLSQRQGALELAGRCGDVDILVNNAGAIPAGDLFSIDDGDWRKAWELKVFGCIELCRSLLPRMKARGRGVVVNVIGVAGERPDAGYVVGGTGNAALMAFTRALGGRSLEDGIRVVGVNPGAIRTERLEEIAREMAAANLGDPERWEELLSARGRLGEPEQVADLVAFLASERASHLSGTIVTIDGGASVGG